MAKFASIGARRSRARRVLDTSLTLLLIVIAGVSCGETPTTGAIGMFRGGPQHLGVYEGLATSGHGVVEWAFQTAGPLRASPLVDSALVLIGSGDGQFYAIDRASGAERWRFQAESAIHSSAASDGRFIFFADRGALYALQRRSGRLEWRFQMGADLPWTWGREGWDYFTSSPALAGDLVVVGSGDGHVYAVDARSGRERWRLETDGRVRSSPAVDRGVVYVGSADGFLYAIELETGELLWRFETQGASLNAAEFGFDRTTIQSSPAVSDGTVYFGSRDGGLYAVNAATGELGWYHDDGTPWVVGSPAIHDGRAYVGTSDGLYVHAVDIRSGLETWRHVVPNRTFSSPALAGSALYVGNHDGRLLALDAASGNPLWDLHLGGAVMSSPVIANDRIYVGCDDGLVYAMRLAAGPAPRRAVYWDAERESWNALSGHRNLRDYFASRGYEVLDRFQLADLMESAISERRRSVIVFAMDDLPRTVATAPVDTVLARRYLEAGGKIVWLGLPPLLLERDEDGAVTGFSRDHPGVLLGVDFQRYDVDQLAAHPTLEGRRWGFSDWWVGISGVDTAEVTTTLAVDDNGDAVAWAKSYGGPPGSGFVFLWGTYSAIQPRHYEQIRRVAEYGIGYAADGSATGSED